MKKISLLLTALLFSYQVTFSATIDTNRVWGLTLDAVNNLSAIVTSLQNLSKKPTTRIVFDEFVPATDYLNAVTQIHNVSFIMGELLDSYYMNQYDLTMYAARTNEYLNLLGNKVDIWEIGNEINGEWLGTTPDVVAKMDTAYSIIKAQNKKTELTLYYNQDCWSNPKNEMFYWVNKNVSARLRNGLDYVLVSYYEDDCNGLQPNWQRVFDSLHVLFPNAKLGIGECGTLTAGKKAAYINRYYKMNITTPNYIGGYFWWYYKQDCVPYTNALWTTFNNAISNSTAPATQASQMSYLALTSSSVQLTWVNGNGSSRAVFIYDGITGSPVLTNGFTYQSNTTYGSGTQAGAGWYCIYNGTGNSVIVNGLQSNHTYRVMVTDYNGNPGFEGYNTSSTTGNPVNIQSAMPVEILYFNYSINRNSARLSWATGKEINNAGFDIERTISGKKEVWQKIGYVKGYGNSENPVSYEFIDNNLSNDKYIYRIKQIDFNGNFEYYYLSGEVSASVPVKHSLFQNYPNPFNNSSLIRYQIKENSGMEKQEVNIAIYDILGKKLQTLVNETHEPGYYEVRFEGSNYATGFYFYALSVNGINIDTKKLAIIK